MSGYELRDIQAQDELPEKEEKKSELPNVVIVSSRQALPGGCQPIDRYSLVFIILLVHGVGTLMPWNMFINADDYFRKYKLTPTSFNSSITNADTDDDSEYLKNLRKNFLSYLSISSQLPNILFSGLNLIVNMESGNLRLRVNITLAVEAVVFAITIALAVIDSSKWPITFFYITLISVVILNMASGIYQNCIFGTGAIFPGTYTNAILIGSNFSGTFTSVVNLLAIWLAPEPQEAAMYYFITALAVILVCIVSYNLLPYNRFYKYFDRASLATEPLEGSNNLTISTNHSNLDEIPETLRNTVDAMVPRPSENLTVNTLRGELMKKWFVLEKCWPQCLNVFLTFFVTLALFPSIMANIVQVQDNFSNKYFSSVACFLIFNVFAMIGNLISGWTVWPGERRVWMLVIARFIFIPFFLFCNFNPTSRRWPVLINNDIAFMIGNILLAISSGYLSSLCMMFASSGLRPDEAPKAGMLAAFFLVLGIFIGICLSFPLTWIVELG